MNVRVLYFAVVRERLGRDAEELELAGGATAEDAWRELVRRHPELGALRAVVKLAVNEEFAGGERALAEGDVIAVIPPVAGGAGGCFRVSEEALSLDEVVRAVTADEQGGVVTFTGVVRSRSRGKRIVRLEYEAYRTMAERKLEEIGAACAQEFGARVAIVHRVGKLAVGDVAVVIAASAPHRAAAFDACRAAIDRLKESVPIWKKEIAEDGEEWIGLGP